MSRLSDQRSRSFQRCTVARDGFQLVQEAIAIWESLEGVQLVEVVESTLTNRSGRLFLAKVVIERAPDPTYVVVNLLDPVDGAADFEEITIEERTGSGSAVVWRDEPWG